jgi:(p)ppGpp synthase/HD superfamily hydrolase
LSRRDSTGPRPLGAIPEERSARLKSRADGGGEAAELFRAAVDRLAEVDTRARLEEAYDYAGSLAYHHPGLSAASYLAHPVRVAVMALQLDPDFEPDTGVIGLLHNVLEVSDATVHALRERFGDAVARAVSDLTVDRSRTDPASISEYYGRLNAGPRPPRVVKILDKLDNLFLLGLNPDDRVRASYLAELELHLLPMVAEELPDLTGYFGELIGDCRTTGVLGKPPADRKGS